MVAIDPPASTYAITLSGKQEAGMNDRPKLRRGFAAMSPEKQLEIARKGGASVPHDKRSFSQDRDLAAEAGRRGGMASHGGGRRAATSQG